MKLIKSLQFVFSLTPRHKRQHKNGENGENEEKQKLKNNCKKFEKTVKRKN